MHDVSTFKTTEFSPQLNILRKIFPGDPWKDTEPRRQAVREDVANGFIKGTHSARSHEFVLWICNEWSLYYGEGAET